MTESVETLEADASEDIVHAEKPWCVVLDTSTWISQFGLHTAHGAALIHVLRIREGFIGLPEVVELELQRKLPERARQFVDSISSGLASMQRILGRRPAVELPSLEEIQELTQTWLTTLEPLFVRVALTEGGARDAVQLAIDGRAPNHRQEQIRDTLIFLAAHELADTHRVLFVSDDKAFFDGLELHEDLASLVEDSGRDLVVAGSIAECLDQLAAAEDETLLDRDVIGDRVLGSVLDEIQTETSRRGFALGSRYWETVRIYATEKPEHLAVTFHATFAIEDLDYSAMELELVGLDEAAAFAREGQSVSARGSAFYDPEDGSVHDPNLELLEFEWLESGVVQRTATHQMRTAPTESR